MSFRIGVDIGGTFTDGILIDEETGDFRIAKVSSTPKDPSIGFMEAVDRLVQGHPDASWTQLAYIVHATTVVTNAVLEGKVSRAALLVTEGFRDLLEIARQTRSSLYDLQFSKPTPLIPRQLVFEIPERLDASGSIVRELDVSAVREVARELALQDIDSVAVCLLHSYRNADHEREIARILGEELPSLLVSLSSDIAPEFREYIRASTTVINAVVRPPVSEYLSRIQTDVGDSGTEAGLLMMQSNGGVTDFRTAAERPVAMVESGPAAGVIAARNAALLLGHEDAFSFDMGGTTAKVGLIQNGEPRIVKDYELGSLAHSQGKGDSGYPIRTPVIDLVEIGAGGGSIAWIDEGGSIRVGPVSAGADPGPVCYRRGGTRPTVTDANLVLGYLNPGYFLGGEIELDVGAAQRAIDVECGSELGLSTEETAQGIVDLANAAMANAFRLISVQRGYDPRGFILVAFGGAGPLHANRLAQAVGVEELIIPPSPGVYSSVGLVSTDLRREDQVSILQHEAEVDNHQVTEAFRVLELKGRDALAEQGFPSSDTRFIRQADMRYVGQGYELTVEATDDDDIVNSLVSAFHLEHERAFGYAALDEPTELVNLRVTTVGSIDPPRPVSGRSGQPNGALKQTRAAYFTEVGGFIDTDVYDRSLLPPGAVIDGPALIEEYDSTTIVGPGYRAEVVQLGMIVIRPSR
jgi:N-methylhydantoinase A